MALSPTYSWAVSSDCETYIFEDTTCNYGVSCPSGYGVPNIDKADVYSTEIIVSDNEGNEWTYSGYLPTQGEVSLTFADFMQTTVIENTVTTDTGCGCLVTTEQATNFEDGCFSVTYKVYNGDIDPEGNPTLEGQVSENFYFYCVTRNRLYDLIEGSCSECCDVEKQNDIWEARQMYEDMLTVYQKVGCPCAEGILKQIQKRLDKLEGNC